MPETKAQTIQRWLSKEEATLLITLNEKGEIFYVGVDEVRVDYTLEDYRKGTNCLFCKQFVLNIHAAQIRLSGFNNPEKPVCPACVAKLKGEE